MAWGTTDQIVTRPFDPKMAYMNEIGDALQRDIDDYRNQSFHDFGLNVRVQPITQSAPIHDIKGRWIGFEKYNFDVWAEPGKVMRIRAYPKGEVKIKYLGRWTHVDSFLKHLKPQVDWNDPADAGDFTREQIVQGRWEQQGRWWVANGKKFPLLDLPPEVREIIYGYVWGDYIEPYPNSKARKLPALTRRALAERTPYRDLLLTCRLINEEASNILFMYTPFLVEHYGIMGPLTSRIQQRVRIRQLELALSHDDFMRLFRKDTLRSSGVVIPGGSREALALRRMKLSRIQLVIQPPSFTTASGVFDGACQKAAVEWILRAARPFIRGHPVRLDGYIKTSQKTVYEAAYLVERKRVELWQQQRATFGVPEGDLKDYDEELNEEDGGVILDERIRSLDRALREEMAEAEEENVSVAPLECHCRVKCTPGFWTPED